MKELPFSDSMVLVKNAAKKVAKFHAAMRS